MKKRRYVQILSAITVDLFFQTHSKSLCELANKEKNVDTMDKHLFILKSSQPACTW